MKPDTASQTALHVAMLRAVHQVLDNPKVFEDPLAIAITGHQSTAEIQTNRARYESTFHTRLRAFVVARSRLVEDTLSEAVHQGIRQYVILGAGLDTFAYRNPYSELGLKVFEIDHPATQDWKQQRLIQAKIPVPETVTFVPVDFEHQSLTSQLHTAGFPPQEPALFSWLGVTMYLTPETVLQTLKEIASFACLGSGIVFDYTTPPATRNPIQRSILHAFNQRMTKMGEPWQGFFEPESLIKSLETMGYPTVEDLDHDAINTKFFESRADQLKVGSSGHLIKATL